jgi:SAM-dependent methyltransferase
MENQLPFSEMPPYEGLWDTGGIISPFQPTVNENVITVLHKVSLDTADVLYDLGCGDGRVLFHAAFMGCKKAVGIELNPDLVSLTQSKIEELGLEQTISVVHQDLLATDIGEATIIYLYLLPEALEKLKIKLKEAFELNTRVIISLHFPIPWWKGEEFANYFIYARQ